MAITSITATMLAGGTSWRIAFTSDLTRPTFYVYRYGLLWQTTQIPFVDVDTNAPETIEVFDDPDDVPTVSGEFPPVAILQWEHVEGATWYEIQKKVDSVWTYAGAIRDSGTWIVQWTSPALADCTAHEFRVRSRGENATGAYLTFVFTMVRIPDHPVATPSVDADTGVLTFV